MKNNFVIVVDSCADLSKEVRQKYGIEYARMGIVKKLKTGDEEVIADLDWEVYTNKELNDWAREGLIMKTTQVTEHEYNRVFRKILEQGQDILYIACSSALSGSYNLSLIVRDELLKEFPDRKIACVDSLRGGYGHGLQALDAAIMKEEGKSLEEIVKYLEENKQTYHQFGTVETLDYLKRAGRVKASAAFFGNLLGVKPIIISDAHGNNYAIKKVKGRRNSLIEMVSMLKEVITNPEEQTVWLVHADELETAEFVKEEVIKQINPKEVRIEYMGPIISVSTGPGTIAVYAKGKEVTVVGD